MVLALIAVPGPFEPENPKGNASFPSIPVISWVPTFANSIVNGTLLSPVPTSILLSNVPKYASSNLTSPKFLSNGPSEPKFPDSIGPSFQSAYEFVKINGTNPIKNNINKNLEFIIQWSPLLKVLLPEMPYHL